MSSSLRSKPKKKKKNTFLCRVCLIVINRSIELLVYCMANLNQVNSKSNWLEYYEKKKKKCLCYKFLILKFIVITI